MSVTLLWALLLNGQEVVAYTSVTTGTQQQNSSGNLAAAPDSKTKTVVKQKVSLEATTSFVALNLPQAVVPAVLPAFAPPADEVLPAYTTSACGSGTVKQLFPVTIQPNAP